MGRPARGARGFPGNRTEAKRAGITPMTSMQSSGLNSILGVALASRNVSPPRASRAPEPHGSSSLTRRGRRSRGGPGPRARAPGPDARGDGPRGVDLVRVPDAATGADALLRDPRRSPWRRNPAARSRSCSSTGSTSSGSTASAPARGSSGPATRSRSTRSRRSCGRERTACDRGRESDGHRRDPAVGRHSGLRTRRARDRRGLAGRPVA